MYKLGTHVSVHTFTFLVDALSFCTDFVRNTT